MHLCADVRENTTALMFAFLLVSTLLQPLLAEVIITVRKDEDSQVVPGQIVSVDIEVTIVEESPHNGFGTSDVKDLSFNMVFDIQDLQFLGFSPGDSVRNPAALTVNQPEGGILNIAFHDALNPLSGFSKHLVAIECEVADDADPGKLINLAFGDGIAIKTDGTSISVPDAFDSIRVVSSPVAGMVNYPGSDGITTGEPIAGIHLVLQSLPDMLSNETETDIEGLYSLEPPGTGGNYNLSFGDGSAAIGQAVNIADAIAIFAHVNNGLYLSNVQKVAADVDGDAIITEADAIMLLDYLFDGGAAPSPWWRIWPQGYDINASDSAWQDLPTNVTFNVFSDAIDAFALVTGDVTLSGPAIAAAVLAPVATTLSRPAEQALQLDNFPNPFNPATTIRYRLPESGTTRIEVYNTIGQRMDVLHNAYQAAGEYQLTWDAGHLSSGVYFFRIVAGGQVMVRKAMYLR